MGVPLQAEFARLQPAPQKNRRRDPNNAQRNNLLPIHGSKIPPFPRGATISFLLFINITPLINFGYACLRFFQSVSRGLPRLPLLPKLTPWTPRRFDIPTA